MPLARTLTRRLGRSDSNTTETPIRSFSTRKALKSDDISLPVNLLSTTNHLSYDAPDIPNAPLAIRIPSSKLLDDAKSQDLASSAMYSNTPSTGTEPELTDGSSAGSTPMGSPRASQPSITANHLSCYFPEQTTRPQSGNSVNTAPQIPSRCPSHNKKEHERLARSRSVSKSDLRTNTLPSPINTQALSELNFNSQPSPQRHSAPSPRTAQHPFASELAKLPEDSEAGSSNSVVLSETATDLADDSNFMIAHGLAVFGLKDYLAEIGNHPCSIDSIHEEMIANGFF